MLKIYLFGTPRIEKDGEIVNVPRKKSLALLSYLVVTQIPCHRDKLAALLYPDYDQARARSNLRRDIFDLKTALAGEIILLEKDIVSLQSVDTYWVDVLEFLHLIQHIHQHHDLSSRGAPITLCADCQSRVSRAVTLYTDDFMAGFSISDSREFEAWQSIHNEDLRQKLAELLDQLVHLHVENSQYNLALDYARRKLLLDELNEQSHREIMRLFAWSGQPASASKQYSNLKQILRRDLGAEPDGETTALLERIRSNNLEPASAHAQTTTNTTSTKDIPSLSQNNLPNPDGTLIGRDHELVQAVRDLRDDPNCRVLTILGPGGIGKTRLAIEVALRLAEDKDCPFCEGIYYVSLAGITQSEMIINAIASNLKLPLAAESDQRAQQLVNFLQTKRVLLLLDNFEQLIDPHSIRFIIALVDQVPQVKLLITSRTRLNIHLEHLLPLQGLEIPSIPAGVKENSMDIVGEYAAVRLFRERARILNPDYQIDQDDLKFVIQICKLVDGMPLGIELAAVWSDLISPAEILQEIKHSLDFLTVKWSDKPEKHHSLHAVFDSSWNLLTQQERSALMRLTVFQGSFTRQSALAVSGASIDILQSLKNKSWLKSVNDRTFQIHDLLCQFASEKLQSDSTAWNQTKQLYMQYYSTQIEEQWMHIRGPKQKGALDWISSEFENIRLAWQWLVEAGQGEFAVLHLLPVLFRYSETRAKPFELIQLIDLALANMASKTSDSTPTLLKSILFIAKASYNEHGTPLRLSETLYHLAQRDMIHQSWQVIGNLANLKRSGFWGLLAAYIYGMLIDLTTSIECLQELAAYYRAANQRWELAYSLFLLGSVQMLNYAFSFELLPFPVGVEPILLEAQSIFAELGDKSQASYVLEMIGRLYYLNGKFSPGKYYQAIDKLQTAVAYQEQVGEFVHYAAIMASLALNYMKLGDHESVLRCYRQTMEKLQAEGDFSGAATALHLESLYSSRYTDIGYAFHSRKESIALYEQEGNKAGAAWGTWEMGELFRLSGDSTQAQEWFDRARSEFIKSGEKPGLTFLSRSDGDLAAMAGDWLSAKIHYERSTELAREMNQVWALSYALTGLAKAEARLGDTISARQHIKQAALIAWQFDRHELTLYTLAGYTQVLVSSGEIEQAIELGTWIINDRLTWNETREQVKSLLHSITLSPELLEAAVERSKLLDIEVVIARFDKMHPG